mmetsp:Transcript_79440/g.246400  ORF Transcript_79440/g.246400 Transcript_79440/m.246400 type:complete len:313 (-) Transcript_79440:769-1707(-)
MTVRGLPQDARRRVLPAGHAARCRRPTAHQVPPVAAERRARRRRGVVRARPGERALLHRDAARGTPVRGKVLGDGVALHPRPAEAVGKEGGTGRRCRRAPQHRAAHGLGREGPARSEGSLAGRLRPCGMAGRGREAAKGARQVHHSVWHGDGGCNTGRRHHRRRCPWRELGGVGPGWCRGAERRRRGELSRGARGGRGQRCRPVRLPQRGDARLRELLRLLRPALDLRHGGAQLHELGLLGVDALVQLLHLQLAQLPGGCPGSRRLLGGRRRPGGVVVELRVPQLQGLVPVSQLLDDTAELSQLVFPGLQSG